MSSSLLNDHSMIDAARNSQCQVEPQNPKSRACNLLKITGLSAILEEHQFGGI
jgi:hypothetical protein